MVVEVCNHPPELEVVVAIVATVAVMVEMGEMEAGG